MLMDGANYMARILNIGFKKEDMKKQLPNYSYKQDVFNLNGYSKVLPYCSSLFTASLCLYLEMYSTKAI